MGETEGGIAPVMLGQDMGPNLVKKTRFMEIKYIVHDGLKI